MSFDEIVTEITAHLNLTSSEATTRVGREVNWYYRSVTTSCNLDTARRKTISSDTVSGTHEVTFFNCEKIEAIYDTATDNPRLLIEATYDELRMFRPQIVGGNPWRYAIKSTEDNNIIVYLDREMSAVHTLEADVWRRVDTLQDNESPSFPESFDDVLIHAVIALEYRKMQKGPEAKVAEDMYQKRLSELRQFLVKSAYIRVQQNQKGSRGPFRRRTVTWQV
jgi:hypothetical protein